MTIDGMAVLADHRKALHLLSIVVSQGDGGTAAGGRAKKVGSVGGSTVFDGRIDLLMTAGDDFAGSVFIDRFPNGEAAARAVQDLITASGPRVYMLAYRPSLGLKVSRRAGFVFRPFRRAFQSDREHQRPSVFEADTERAPTSEAMERFAARDRQQPMLMLNLNRYYDRARYPDGDRGRTGEQAYQRYGARSGPVIASMGGYPALGGPIIAEIATGIPQLSGGWDEVILAYYPTRQAFMNMVTNPRTQSGITDRDAAVERAALVSTIQRT